MKPGLKHFSKPLSVLAIGLAASLTMADIAEARRGGLSSRSSSRAASSSAPAAKTAPPPAPRKAEAPPPAAGRKSAPAAAAGRAAPASAVNIVASTPLRSRSQPVERKSASSAPAVRQAAPARPARAGRSGRRGGMVRALFSGGLFGMLLGYGFGGVFGFLSLIMQVLFIAAIGRYVVRLFSGGKAAQAHAAGQDDGANAARRSGGFGQRGAGGGAGFVPAQPSSRRRSVQA